MPDELLHIVITGPESSGKTTLARKLAAHFQTLWVPEYARWYLEERGAVYSAPDLLQIARGQYLWERYTAAFSNGLFFSDTSMLVMKVWGDFRFGATHPWILERLTDPPDLYLLCGTDLPWQPDSLRESADLAERQHLYEIYLSELRKMSVPFAEITGAGEKRFRRAVQAVEDFLPE